MRLTRLLWAVCTAGVLGSTGWAQESNESETFRDVTNAAGIDFLHTNGRAGELFVIEVKGSGVAFVDYDNDGDLDIYAVNGNNLPGAKTDVPPINHLYRNNGDGSFTDVTATAGVGDGGYGHGVAAADYDNDGDQDLYVVNYGANVLYRNNGDGTFTDVTVAAGVAGEEWSASAAFCDLNNDGHLDIYVANYLVFDIHSTVRLPNGPAFYEGAMDRLYLSKGDGTFHDATQANIGNPNGKGLGVVCLDYDDDGDLDVYVANDGTVNLLYENKGNAEFEDVTLFSGTGVNGTGVTEAGMGIDAGDFDNDGDMDLFVTNYKSESNTLYRNDGGVFTDASLQANLVASSLPYVTFGAGFFDYDNDAELDIFVANGHTEEDEPDHEQPPQLFRNLGNGRYDDVSAVSGSPFATPRVGRGVAFGDFDNDGDVDLLVSNKNDRLALLQNQIGNRRNWLAVRTVGTQSNRDGIGARVRISTQHVTRVKDVKTGYSMYSSNDPRVYFGLGDIERVTLEIRWPSGTIDRIEDVPANVLAVVTEGSGKAEISSLRPIETSYVVEAVETVAKDQVDPAMLEHSVQQLRALVAANSRDVSEYLRHGKNLVVWIDQQTRQYFDELLAADPNRADVLLEYGAFLESRLELTAAAEVFERAAAVSDQPEKSNAAVARLNLRVGRFAEAAEAATKAHATGDVSPAAYGYLAKALAGLDRNAEARTVLESMVQRYPRSVAGFLALGQVHVAGNRFDEAVQAYRAAVRLEPNAQAYRYQLAEAYRRAGDDRAYGQQMTIYRLLEAESAMFKGGMAPAAEIDLLKREIRMNPLFGQTRAERQLALRYDRLGDEVNEKLFSARARVSELKDEIADRLDTLRRTVQLDPTSERRSAFRAINDLRQQMARSMNSIVGYALEEAPEHLASARNALAERRLDAALAGFRLALSSDPDNAAAYHGLVDVHLASGLRLDQARLFAHRAARLDHSTASYKLLAKVYRSIGDDTAAQRYLAMAEVR